MTPTVPEDTFGLGPDLALRITSLAPVLGSTLPPMVMTFVNTLWVLMVGLLVQLLASFLTFTVGYLPSAATSLTRPTCVRRSCA